MCDLHLGLVHLTVCWVLSEGRVSLQPSLIFPNWHEPSNSSIAGHVPLGVPSLRALEVTGCGSCGSSDLARLSGGHVSVTLCPLWGSRAMGDAGILRDLHAGRV